MRARFERYVIRATSNQTRERTNQHPTPQRPGTPDLFGVHVPASESGYSGNITLAGPYTERGPVKSPQELVAPESTAGGGFDCCVPGAGPPESKLAHRS